MRTSVVIRSKDEARRLRLVLASLRRQAGLDEVVVVDDGSRDETTGVLAEAAQSLPLVAVRHDAPKGRSEASNAGAGAATGDLLIFLDGDTLAGPGMVAAHIAAHPTGGDLVGRGETWNLRCTRFLADPETGAFWPDQAARGVRLSAEEQSTMRVTLGQVDEDFEAVARRAAPGVYAGAAPRRLHEIEMEALRRQPDSSRLWAAASGSNLSVRRDRFLAAGGLDPALDINEHRELAYRLCADGARMVPAEGARTYHLTHRTGWRDPLQDAGWEQTFRRRHPEAPIDALKRLWLNVFEEGASPAFFDA